MAEPVALHAGEVPVDHRLVVRLLTEQFPELAGLPVRAVRSTGTVNAIYRVGEQHYVRLPRKAEWSADIAKECRWLPELAPRLPVPIPAPVATGHPTADYPLPWAIFDWIDGRPYADELVADESQVATALAGFVLALRRIAPVAAAPAGGRRPLAELAEETEQAIEQAGDVIDRAAVAAVWRRAVATAPVWAGPSVWVHADLLRPNLLVADGRLAAVIDFGAAGVGDPAMDVIAAWSVFGPTGRAAYRSALDVDDGIWHRARGIALHQAVDIIPYYRESNPEFAELARRTVEQVLLDPG